MSYTWLIMVVAVSVLSTYVWRAAGMLIASHLHPDSALSRWFSCVAYAVLAGLIARMIILPEGALALAPLPDKLIALGCGFAVFFITRRNVVSGTATAFLVFMAIALARHHFFF